MRCVAATIVTVAGSVSGCSSLLDVELPGRIPVDVLGDPGIAGTLVASAISDFECAFDSYVTATALLTDEIQHSSTTALLRKWDLREISADDNDNALAPCGSQAFTLGTYTPLQTARWQADNALKRLEAYTDAQVPSRTALIATASAYAGYGYLLLGEGYCEMAVDLGPLLTPAQVLSTAEQRFTNALTLAQTAQNQAVLNLARVGRARTRLDHKRGADAVADAQLVAANFSQNATRDTDPPRRWNKIWNLNIFSGQITVDPTFRNVTWQSVPDPRVSTFDTGRNGNSPGVRLWATTTKASANSTPFRLASWVEAQLIVAEVIGGQAAVDVINTLHQRAGIPGFSSSDPATIAAQVREERRRELYLEGHRLNDMLRLKIPFPSGVHPVDGNPYGTTTCLPLPTVERTGNPNIGS